MQTATLSVIRVHHPFFVINFLMNFANLLIVSPRHSHPLSLSHTHQFIIVHHSRLPLLAQIYLFHKFFPLWLSYFFDHWTDYGLLSFSLVFSDTPVLFFLFIIIFLFSLLCARLSWLRRRLNHASYHRHII